ncbi:MAG: helix-turn-helix transcriptional regulator [Clostridiales bacterium]|nr:helix-turn-helix transcriptional regulator [Clostridiales bacterium]
MDNMNITDFTVREQVSENIKRLLEQNGINQKQLAEKTHVAEALISSYKNGKALPPLSFLLSLKSIYGISIDDFLSKDITPAAYDTLPPTSEIEKEELEDYSRYEGTYYLYYFNTGNYKGNDHNPPGASLMYGIMHIYATPSPMNRLGHSVVCIMGIGSRSEAIETRYLIENSIRNHSGTFAKVVESMYSKRGSAPAKEDEPKGRKEKDQALPGNQKHIGIPYYGVFEMNHSHAFITIKQSNKDQALIILHRTPTPATPTKYNSGIGTINSISKGREPMPAIQFIGLSRENTRLSDEELHHMLLLSHISVKDSHDTDELISFIKKQYTDPDESLTDFQRDITVKGALSAYVRRVVDRNLFRVGKISNRDDDAWYHMLKDTFLKQ